MTSTAAAAKWNAELGRRAHARRRRAALQVAALAATVVAATLTGAVDASWSDGVAALHLLAAELFPQAETTHADSGAAAVLAFVRVPRVLLAGAVGATLGVCGAALQGLFRNPLADPSLLGMSAGAAMAVVIVTVATGTVADLAATALGRWLVPSAAFAGALGSVVVVHRFSLASGRTVAATMLLAGVGVNALAGAITGFLLSVANDAQLRSFTFWSLGSMAGASWRMLAVAAPFLLLACASLPRLALSLDAMNLGHAEAAHLGVDVERTTRILLVASSLGVAASVAAAGAIGFVGLVVPHLVRLAFGSDHRTLLASSALVGATLLVAADLGARTLAAPAEIPIGVLTALVGAPLLLWLLGRDRRRIAS